MVCEIEYKGQELLPRALVAVSVVFGAVGIAAYLGGQKEEPRLSALKRPEARVETAVLNRAEGPELAPVRQAVSPVNPAAEPRSTPNVTNARPSVVSSTADEKPTFCGAETRKGTPCSRRVKGGGRCFQHVGMPQMSVGDARIEKSVK